MKKISELKFKGKNDDYFYNLKIIRNDVIEDIKELKKEKQEYDDFKNRGYGKIEGKIDYLIEKFEITEDELK